MTKLIVTPIDPAAPGSFKARKRIMRLGADLMKAGDEDNMLAMMEVYENLESIVRDRLETDDGTSVDDALDMCSWDEFLALIKAVLGKETIPPATSGG